MFELMPFDRKNRNLTNYFDKFEKDFFNNFFSGVSIPEFKTDVLDKGDKYVLQAELPGFQKEDIHIDLNGDRLVIRAERKEETEEKNEKDCFVHRERHYGSYTRAFDVSGIQADRITAEYKDGILELELPKEAPTAPASRRIELK